MAGQRAQCRSMMYYNELVPAQASVLVPHAGRPRFAAAAYLARFKGGLPATTPTPICAATSPGAPTATGPVPGPAPAPGAVHPVDAGDPPVQAPGGLPPGLRHRRVLPDLRHRRRGPLHEPRGSLTSVWLPASGCYDRTGL